MPANLDLASILEESFDAIDLNHDGFLTQDEIAKALEKLGLNPNRSSAFMKQFDINKDGKISRDEYLKASQTRLDQREVSCACLRRMFQEIDRNKDGKLSKDELKSFMRNGRDFVFPISVEQWVDEYGHNKDAEISYEDFLHIVEDYL
ncbi:unnamed protein product [Calicophoron daubneyi]|uniref:EF-hand domain-containing protein n=1 Tax=Calicophoron daubneyi TaxID=300641 RepID=A0AAV2TJR0_CALDB